MEENEKEPICFEGEGLEEVLATLILEGWL